MHYHDYISFKFNCKYSAFLGASKYSGRSGQRYAYVDPKIRSASQSFKAESFCFKNRIGWPQIAGLYLRHFCGEALYLKEVQNLTSPLKGPESSIKALVDYIKANTVVYRIENLGANGTTKKELVALRNRAKAPDNKGRDVIKTYFSSQLGFVDTYRVELRLKIPGSDEGALKTKVEALLSKLSYPRVIGKGPVSVTKVWDENSGSQTKVYTPPPSFKEIAEEIAEENKVSLVQYKDALDANFRKGSNACLDFGDYEALLKIYAADEAGLLTCNKEMLTDPPDTIPDIKKNLLLCLRKYWFEKDASKSILEPTSDPENGPEPKSDRSCSLEKEPSVKYTASLSSAAGISMCFSEINKAETLKKIIILNEATKAGIENFEIRVKLGCKTPKVKLCEALQPMVPAVIQLTDACVANFNKGLKKQLRDASDGRSEVLPASLTVDQKKHLKDIVKKIKAKGQKKHLESCSPGPKSPSAEQAPFTNETKNNLMSMLTSFDQLEFFKLKEDKNDKTWKLSCLNLLNSIASPNEDIQVTEEHLVEIISILFQKSDDSQPILIKPETKDYESMVVATISLIINYARGSNFGKDGENRAKNFWDNYKKALFAHLESCK